MFTREFWLGDNGALVRSIRTWAQTAAALIAASTFSPFDLGHWWDVLIVAGTSGVLSILMSLDRRESLLAPSPVVAKPDPAAADYLPPSFAVGGYGGNTK